MAVIYVCDRCEAQQRDPLRSISQAATQLLASASTLPGRLGMLCEECASEGESLIAELAGEVSARINDWRARAK